jgi:hypothetical protein
MISVTIVFYPAPRSQKRLLVLVFPTKIDHIFQQALFTIFENLFFFSRSRILGRMLTYNLTHYLNEAREIQDNVAE